MTVFGTYDFLVLHYMSINTDDSSSEDASSFSVSRERSTVLAHFAAGACAGWMQSTVLTSWELATKMKAHHMQLPHNIRTRFLIRRAVHHSIGYASLFGTYEATRRLLLHAAYPFLQSHNATLSDNVNRNVVSLTAAFVAGGIAGQVHQFVSYITSHWKLQALQSASSDFSVSRHAKQYSRLMPTLKANLSAFGPTALCFVAFQYGEDFTARLVE